MEDEELANTITAHREVYISVDVETAGPVPSEYSLLSIGACMVADPHRTFYVEIQPINDQAVPEALLVSGLSLAELVKNGLPPDEALSRFEDWLMLSVPAGYAPVFVGFNAPFDWMFINEYFYRFLGRNPFGHSALDIKAYFMGMSGVKWTETGMSHVGERYLEGRRLSHNALQDAIDQAELFRKMLSEQALRRPDRFDSGPE
jgi:DNA polymerase III epsilon subunit-like protein